MNLETAVVLFQIVKSQGRIFENFADEPELKALDYLQKNQLITLGGDYKYEATDRGLALIDHWLDTPLPTAVWEVER